MERRNYDGYPSGGRYSELRQGSDDLYSTTSDSQHATRDGSRLGSLDGTRIIEITTISPTSAASGNNMEKPIMVFENLIDLTSYENLVSQHQDITVSSSMQSLSEVSRISRRPIHYRDTTGRKGNIVLVSHKESDEEDEEQERLVADEQRERPGQSFSSEDAYPFEVDVSHYRSPPESIVTSINSRTKVGPVFNITDVEVVELENRLKSTRGAPSPQLTLSGDEYSHDNRAAGTTNGSWGYDGFTKYGLIAEPFPGMISRNTSMQSSLAVAVPKEKHQYRNGKHEGGQSHKRRYSSASNTSAIIVTEDSISGDDQVCHLFAFSSSDDKKHRQSHYRSVFSNLSVSTAATDVVPDLRANMTKSDEAVCFKRNESFVSASASPATNNRNSTYTRSLMINVDDKSLDIDSIGVLEAVEHTLNSEVSIAGYSADTKLLDRLTNVYGHRDNNADFENKNITSHFGRAISEEDMLSQIAIKSTKTSASPQLFSFDFENKIRNSDEKEIIFIDDPLMQQPSQKDILNGDKSDRESCGIAPERVIDVFRKSKDADGRKVIDSYNLVNASAREAHAIAPATGLSPKNNIRSFESVQRSPITGRRDNHLFQSSPKSPILLHDSQSPSRSPFLPASSPPGSPYIQARTLSGSPMIKNQGSAQVQVAQTWNRSHPPSPTDTKDVLRSPKESCTKTSNEDESRYVRERTDYDVEWKQRGSSNDPLEIISIVSLPLDVPRSCDDSEEGHQEQAQPVDAESYYRELQFGKAACSLDLISVIASPSDSSGRTEQLDCHQTDFDNVKGVARNDSTAHSPSTQGPSQQVSRYEQGSVQYNTDTEVEPVDAEVRYREIRRKLKSPKTADAPVRHGPVDAEAKYREIEQNQAGAITGVKIQASAPASQARGFGGPTHLLPPSGSENGIGVRDDDQLKGRALEYASPRKVSRMLPSRRPEELLHKKQNDHINKFEDKQRIKSSSGRSPRKAEFEERQSTETEPKMSSEGGISIDIQGESRHVSPLFTTDNEVKDHSRITAKKQMDPPVQQSNSAESSSMVQPSAPNHFSFPLKEVLNEGAPEQDSIVKVEIDPENTPVVDSGRTDVNDVSTGPDRADTAGPDSTYTAEPDGAVTAGPDSADTAGPDSADTAGPDSADTAGPNSANIAGPDSTDSAVFAAATAVITAVTADIATALSVAENEPANGVSELVSIVFNEPEQVEEPQESATISKHQTHALIQHAAADLVRRQRKAAKRQTAPRLDPEAPVSSSSPPLHVGLSDFPVHKELAEKVTSKRSIESPTAAAGTLAALASLRRVLSSNDSIGHKSEASIECRTASERPGVKFSDDFATDACSWNQSNIIELGLSGDQSMLRACRSSQDQEVGNDSSGEDAIDENHRRENLSDELLVADDRANCHALLSKEDDSFTPEPQSTSGAKCLQRFHERKQFSSESSHTTQPMRSSTPRSDQKSFLNIDDITRSKLVQTSGKTSGRSGEREESAIKSSDDAEKNFSCYKYKSPRSNDSTETGDNTKSLSKYTISRSETNGSDNNEDATYSKVSIVDSFTTESDLEVEPEVYDTCSVPYAFHLLDKACAWLESEDSICGYRSRPSLLTKVKQWESTRRKQKGSNLQGSIFPNRNVFARKPKQEINMSTDIPEGSRQQTNEAKLSLPLKSSHFGATSETAATAKKISPYARPRRQPTNAGQQADSKKDHRSRFSAEPQSKTTVTTPNAGTESPKSPVPSNTLRKYLFERHLSGEIDKESKKDSNDENEAHGESSQRSYEGSTMFSLSISCSGRDHETANGESDDGRTQSMDPQTQREEIGDSTRMRESTAADEYPGKAANCDTAHHVLSNVSSGDRIVSVYSEPAKDSEQFKACESEPRGLELLDEILNEDQSKISPPGSMESESSIVESESRVVENESRADESESRIDPPSVIERCDSPSTPIIFANELDFSRSIDKNAECIAQSITNDESMKLDEDRNDFAVLSCEPISESKDEEVDETVTPGDILKSVQVEAVFESTRQRQNENNAGTSEDSFNLSDYNEWSVLKRTSENFQHKSDSSIILPEGESVAKIWQHHRAPPRPELRQNQKSHSIEISSSDHQTQVKPLDLPTSPRLGQSDYDSTAGLKSPRNTPEEERITALELAEKLRRRAATLKLRRENRMKRSVHLNTDEEMNSPIHLIDNLHKEPLKSGPIDP